MVLINPKGIKSEFDSCNISSELDTLRLIQNENSFDLILYCFVVALAEKPRDKNQAEKNKMNKWMN